MKLSEEGTFDASALSLGAIPEGTSILLTGDDTDAIETVFYHLVAAGENERSLILATETNGRTVNRELDRIEYGISNRSTVLSCRGATDSNITTVDDIADLAGVGMQFSALVAESGTMAASQRAGILLCSSICQEVDDIQSVFRFLNANFLSHLRRDGIMGVCAVDTSAEIGGKIDGLVETMAEAFSAHISVESADSEEVTLHLDGDEVESKSVTLTLSD
jgi:hypothetical protein